MNVKVVPAISCDQKGVQSFKKTHVTSLIQPWRCTKTCINCTLQHMLHSHTEGYRKLTPCMNEYHLQLWYSHHLQLETPLPISSKTTFLVTKKLFPIKSVQQINAQGSPQTGGQSSPGHGWSFGKSAGGIFRDFFHQLWGGRFFRVPVYQSWWDLIT